MHLVDTSPRKYCVDNEENHRRRVAAAVNTIIEVVEEVHWNEARHWPEKARARHLDLSFDSDFLSITVHATGYEGEPLFLEEKCMDEAYGRGDHRQKHRES